MNISDKRLGVKLLLKARRKVWPSVQICSHEGAKFEVFFDNTTGYADINANEESNYWFYENKPLT